MSFAQLVFKRYETKYLLDAEHLAYKEKTRTCRYGTPHPFDPVFVELKKKCDGVVYKRRRGARARFCPRRRPSGAQPLDPKPLVHPRRSARHRVRGDRPR